MTLLYRLFGGSRSDLPRHKISCPIIYFQIFSGNEKRARDASEALRSAALDNRAALPT